MNIAGSASINQLLAGTANVQATRHMQVQDAAIRTEIARKAATAGSSGAVTTDFTYSLGSDGQLYVSGGQVSTSRKVSARQLTGTRGEGANDNGENRSSFLSPRRKASFGDVLPPQVAISPFDLARLQESRDNPLALAELTQMDAGVRSHEHQHFAAAGGLASGIPEYEYIVGPDGQLYASGGHVDISSTPTNNPQKAARDAAGMARAASAPGDASAQDAQVGGGALSKAAAHYANASHLGNDNTLDMVA